MVLAGLVLASSGVGTRRPGGGGARQGRPCRDGLVLVAVRPADPAVLPLVTPGSRVDVYAADGGSGLDPLGEGRARRRGPRRPRRARRVRPGRRRRGAGAGPAGPEARWPLAGARAGRAAVPLLVTDAEAAALAAGRPGRSRSPCAAGRQASAP